MPDIQGDEMNKAECWFINEIRKNYMKYISLCDSDTEFDNPSPDIKKIREVIEPVITKYVNEVLNK
jgi:hypothetical protein